MGDDGPLADVTLAVVLDDELLEDALLADELVEDELPEDELLEDALIGFIFTVSYCVTIFLSTYFEMKPSKAALFADKCWAADKLCEVSCRMALSSLNRKLFAGESHSAIHLL